MGTDALSRRRALQALALLGTTPWHGHLLAAGGTTLLAAWQQDEEQHIGQFHANGGTLVQGPTLVVPTRAHGLCLEPQGSVLAAARRPGDWLLRWDPRDGRTQWLWADDDRRFNGHVIRSAAGQRVWTTETDLDTARGRIGVRDVRSLDKDDEWASHGMDPHQLLALPEALGAFPAGTLIVANGGIPTLPETGRLKRSLDRMDASLVALHPGSGELIGQWRLAQDPYLSIRHLAWDPVSRTLGIALQAEHRDVGARRAAPVLAIWDSRRLATAQGQPPLEGYGGDICALPGGGFAVSCPRADRVALYDGRGRFLRAIAHPQAYALGAAPGYWWSGGRDATLAVEGSGLTRVLPHPAATMVFDNHWQIVPA
ncbi:MAG: DUF1513 domain-containing protein [Hydrogenophaga sp.]